MRNFVIRQFEENDINRIAHLQPEGWEDISGYFRFYLEKSFCYPIATIFNNQIVGVANGIFSGDTGWLSHIIVSQKYRGMGIGQKLTQHIIDYLYSNGCKTQLLIATAMGKNLYKRLGFKGHGSYIFFLGPQLQIKPNNKNIRPLVQTDIRQLLQIDKQLTGEDRKQVLESFGLKGWGYFDSDSQGLLGYYLPEIAEGTIIGKTQESGIELLKLKHSQKKCKAVLPVENENGIEFLISSGFEKHTEVSRMILGEPLEWEPRFIYSRIGGFYG